MPSSERAGAGAGDVELLTFVGLDVAEFVRVRVGWRECWGAMIFAGLAGGGAESAFEAVDGRYFRTRESGNQKAGCSNKRRRARCGL